ncbi:hypothetical protein C9J85_05450 [Haloferax sp. wsp5]|nr:hypothetical protein C9J85_05450 [Haloferax sp. wsp5]
MNEESVFDGSASRRRARRAGPGDDRTDVSRRLRRRRSASGQSSVMNSPTSLIADSSRTRLRAKSAIRTRGNPG